MADKWQAVMHPDTGLVPNFFGSAGWQPGADQLPGEWVCSRGASLTATAWLEAAAELARRSGGEELRERLTGMGLRLARGVAARVYDAGRRVFREHLHLDGRAYEQTARYCFATQQEKDAAVAGDPEMAQVKVYDGAGFYRPPNYFERCAGSNIPFDLGRAAAMTGDTELVERVSAFAADAVEASRELSGPLTPEGRWTFRATGWYVKMCVLLHRATGDGAFLDRARELADRELVALRQPTSPGWWHMRERSTLLDAMLELHAALQIQHHVEERRRA
jgi:hypothetical protein